MYETNNIDSRKALINYIENVIPKDDIVMLYTRQRTVSDPA